MENNSNGIGTFVKNVIKNGFKKLGKTIALKLALPCLIILILLAGFYFIKELADGVFKAGDSSNVPYMVSTFTNDISIDEDGNITTELTAQELWDELVKHDSDIAKYLDTPEELKKLIMAQLVTQYPDTRSDPDKEISDKDWKKINDADSNKVQGIIKFKRADIDGNISTLTYVSPETFQSYIEDYNKTGSEKAKKKAMSHFTIDLDNDNFADSDMGIIQGNGEFTKYGLTSAQIKAIANVCQQEQGTAKGAAAEASLMANRFELYGKSYGNIYNYVRTSGWFANAAHFMDNGSSDTATVQAVNAVLNGGNRTLPLYVDEHDCINPPDITSCANNGNSFSTSDRSSYKQYITKIKNRYGSTYTFFCFPTSTSDPFGYTNAKYRKKYGDAYYDFETGNLINGKDNNSSENNGNNSDENNEENKNTNNSSKGKGFGNGKLKWPTVSDNITSTFGPRSAPIAGASTNHGAVDIGGTDRKMGEDVWACEDGTVLYTYNTAPDGTNKEANGHAGNWVVIDHGNGYVSKYMHLQQGTVVVTPGQKVKKGDLIAKLGNSGNSTGPHLHFQIEKNGTKVDPMDFDYDKSVGSSSSSNSSSSSSSGGSKYNVLVATWSENSNTLTSNDPGEAGSTTETTYNMTTTSINYQEFTSGYTMPFEYLWAFLIIGMDKDFTSELADLVYGSQLEITIHDNLTIDTNVITDTYTKKKKTDTTAQVTINYGEQSSAEHSAVADGSWSDEESNSYTVTNTTVTKTNTLDIALTKANVWIVDYEQEFTYQKPESTTTTTNQKLDDIPYPDTPNETTQGQDTYGHAAALLATQQAEYKKTWTYVGGYINSIEEKIYNATVDRNKKIEDTVETTKYVSSPANIDMEKKTDKKSSEPNFVTIFLSAKCRKAKNLIINGRLILFQILEKNDSTKDMVDLTKYLLYKATGQDYGVTKYEDLSAFDPANFVDISGDNSGDSSGIDGIPGQIYDFLLQKGVSPVAAAAILGNVEQESSFNPANDNGSGCYGLFQWKGGRFDNLKKVAQKNGKDWTDVDSQLEYLWNELNGSYYKHVKDVIMNTKKESEMEYATWYWGRHFEVFFNHTSSFEASKNYTKNRYEYAQKWYKKYNESAKTSNNSKGATANSSDDIKKYNLHIQNGYIEYKQYDYTTIPPSYNATGTSGTIKEKGCMPTSISIILSGMGITDSKGKAYTPETLISSNTIKQSSSGSSTYPNAVNTFKRVGLKATDFKSTSGKANDIIKELKAGKAIMIHASAGYYTSFGHFMTLIDVKNSNVYLSNPGNSTKTGWININTLLSRNVDLYCVVSK